MLTGPRPPLLSTKLHAPRPRREMVDRRRLTDRAAASLPPLTLVSAPAGFGKTTLLTDWCADADRHGRSVAWLSLDERDNDPTLFWSYLLAAFATVDPAIGEDASSLLQEAQPLESVASSLLNDLARHEGEILVVLDDFHVIGSTEICTTVSFLIEHVPPPVHLVIASRADPPLPLARLRARGDLLEVRAADLRFTAEEAEAYLHESMGLDLSDRDVAVLEARTEGWIAALQLAALSMRGRDDPSSFIATFAGDDRFVVDFLAEEVLEQQPDDVRRFLLQTATLDRFTGSLCDAVTGDDDGRATLEQLDRANLFLVPLDDRRLWYRYHHLFAEVLRARLLDEAPESVIEIHRRAAEWHEVNGDRAEAISHALSGNDPVHAARLIEIAAPQLRQSRQDATLRTWLEALPDEVFTDRPVLAMALVGARVATHDPAGVDALLEAVESTLAPTSPPPIVFDHEEFARLPAQLLVHRAGVAMLAGDFGATIPLGNEVLALVAPSDDRLRGVAHGLLGLGHWAAGDLVAAAAHYVDAVAAFIRAGYLPDMLGCSLAMADIQIALGQLTDAADTFEAGLRWTNEHAGLRGAADMHVGLSEVLIERNQLDAATEHLQASVTLGEVAGLPQHAYRWRVTKARLCRAHGDLEGALRLIDDAAPLYDTDFSPPVRPVAALRTRVLLARGDLVAATRWATDRRLRVDDELTYVNEFEHITLTRVLLARHAAEQDPRLLTDALGLLDRLLTAADAGQRAGSAIEILILQATGLHATGDLAAAAAALAEALRRSEPEGHIRLFLHAGPAVVSMLRSIASTDQSTPHARLVLAATEPTVASSTSPPPTSTLVDGLSARELDVLRLLRSDLSGPDIARELHVSLNTMRTHTKKIYLKLDVNNRREAVRRAEELGL